MANVHIFEEPGAGSKVTQLMIFNLVWQFSDKRSFISGLFLRQFQDTPFFLNCFAHVLPKRLNAYPHFKYYAGNIALLTPGEHSLYDQGTEEARINYAMDLEEKNGKADWQKLYDKRDELIDLYHKEFPSKRGLILAYKYSPEEVMHIVGHLNKRYFNKKKIEQSKKKS